VQQDVLVKAAQTRVRPELLLFTMLSLKAVPGLTPFRAATRVNTRSLIVRVPTVVPQLARSHNVSSGGYGMYDQVGMGCPHSRSSAVAGVQLVAPQNTCKWSMMRHGNKLNRLERPADQRKALIRGLVTEVIKHGKITTTKVLPSVSTLALLCIRLNCTAT
jgi:hypothetical protein